MLEKLGNESEQYSATVDQSLLVLSGRADRHRAVIDTLQRELGKTATQMLEQARQLALVRQECAALRGGLEALGRRTLPDGGFLALLRDADMGTSAQSGLGTSSRGAPQAGPPSKEAPKQKKRRVKDEKED